MDKKTNFFKASRRRKCVQRNRFRQFIRQLQQTGNRLVFAKIFFFLLSLNFCCRQQHSSFLPNDEITFFLVFLRLAITDHCQDTDDTDEYVLSEIDEYELDYTSASEDLFSSGSSSGTDVIILKKKRFYFRKINRKKIQKKKIIGHCESDSKSYIQQQLGRI